MVALLLDKGADMEANSNVRMCSARSFLSIIHSLRTICRKQIGNTPLVIAALKDNKEAVELLLEKGADIEAKTHNVRLQSTRPLVKMSFLLTITAEQHGFTSLIIAAMEGHKEVVTLLLAKGATMEATSNVRVQSARPFFAVQMPLPAEFFGLRRKEKRR